MEAVVAPARSGARMTGGGFGGSALALVPDAEHGHRFEARIRAAYAGPRLDRAGLPGRAPVGQRAAAVVTGMGATPRAARSARTPPRSRPTWPSSGTGSTTSRRSAWTCPRPSQGLGALDGLPLEVTMGRRSAR